MKIFYNFDPNSITQLKYTHELILNTIEKLGHEYDTNWIKRYDNTNPLILDDLMYAQMISEILSSDVVILEASQETTSIGFQLAYALQKNKPTLTLINDLTDMQSSIVNGIKAPILTVKKYTEDTLEELLTKYLVNNAEETRVRFNLVINKQQDNYIEWAAFNDQKSKTEIIKQAIDLLKANDERYHD